MSVLMFACMSEWSSHECDMYRKWRTCLKENHINYCDRLLREYECDDPRMSREECDDFIRDPSLVEHKPARPLCPWSPSRWAVPFCYAFNSALSVSQMSNDAFLLDVGAAFGYEIKIARRANIPVIGFECNSDEYQRLKQMFAADPNVTMIHACLGDHVGVTELYRAADSSSTIRTNVMGPGERWKHRREKRKVETVPLLTLDHVVRTLNVKVGFLKIDVQGAEESVLRGAVETIRRQRPHVFYEDTFTRGGASLLHRVVHVADEYICKCPCYESNDDCYCVPRSAEIRL